MTSCIATDSRRGIPKSRTQAVAKCCYFAEMPAVSIDELIPPHYTVKSRSSPSDNQSIASAAWRCEFGVKQPRSGCLHDTGLGEIANINMMGLE